MLPDIYKTHQDLKKKKITSTEITQECLVVAKKSQNPIFISLLEDYALLKAKEADARFQKGKAISYLDGIPFNLKDLFITKNIRTTASSMSLYNYIPAYEGYTSDHLQSAGAVLIGKVSCDQYGMGSSNENTPFPVPHHPLDKTRVAGGSSGSTAVSIAEGSSFFGVGTDTGGSTRLPANFCGLVGFKPSYGRVSRYGQIAYASSLDQTSPFSRTVLDMACIMQELTYKDPRDATQAPLGQLKVVEELASLKSSFLKGKKIGFVPEFYAACSSEIKTQLDKALDIFKKQGASIVDVSLPNAKYAISVYYLIATSEASANLARFDGIHYGHRSKKPTKTLEETYIHSRTEGFGDEVKRRILLGTFSLSSGYQDAYFAKACKVRRLIHDDFLKAHTNCDAIFMPVCANSAFKLGDGDNDPFQIYMNDLYTIPVNLAGLPAIAIPFGKVENNIPTGFQLVGKMFEDGELLKLARAFEVTHE